MTSCCASIRVSCPHKTNCCYFSNDRLSILHRSRSSIRYFKTKSKKTLDHKRRPTTTCIVRCTITPDVTALMKSQKNTANHREAVLRHSPKGRNLHQVRVNTWCVSVSVMSTASFWRTTHDGPDFAKRTVLVVRLPEDQVVAKENAKRAKQSQQKSKGKKG